MQAPASYVANVALTSATLTPAALSAVLGHPAGTALVVAFISPHCDFAGIAHRLRALTPGDATVLAVSTAGELWSDGTQAPYCPTGDNWDRVVVQSFSRALVAETATYAVPLPNGDLRGGGPRLTHDERLAHLGESLRQVTPPFVCDHRDTFILTFFDGLSRCENLLMEAVYRSNRYPLLMVGGSAGGKADFRHTYLFDGERVLEDHAIMCFVRLAQGMRYGAFRSQNFQRTGGALVVAEADGDRNTVRTAIDPATGVAVPFLDAVARLLACRRDQVPARLAAFSFAAEINDELYLRSIAAFDLTDGSATFFCDIDFGDTLLLVEAIDFNASCGQDFRAFLAGKPPPLAGLLHDCVLRRQDNSGRLGGLDAFAGIPLAGFSTFGEVFGILVNQTLTALFFFGGDGAFRDDLIDRFPIHYAAFRSFFDARATYRLRAQAEVRETRARLERHLVREQAFSQAVISSLPGIFYLLDRQGRIVLWNANLVAVTGFAAAELGGRAAVDLFAGEDRARVAEAIEAVFAGGRSDIEASLIARDGRAIPHGLTGVAVTLDGEPYLAYIGIDNSQRELAARALEEQAAAVARSNAELEQFAYVASHDLREPLRMINSYLTLLARRYDALFDQDARDFIGFARDAAVRMDHLVLDLLEYSRVGRSDHPHRPVDAGQAVAAAIAGLTLLIEETGADVAVDGPLPTVPADSDDLVRLFQNLIGNALKYRRPGVPPRIRIGCRCRGRRWEFSVSDNGIGIAPEQRDAIFLIFRRLHGRCEYEGTGIGLAICKKIVEQHGGGIAVDSTLGVGSTFRFVLPVVTTADGH